jgi:hypothetical protein
MMNVLKNMEVVFLVTAAVALSGAEAWASVPAPRVAPSQVAVSGGKMVSVIITGKRATALQKALAR